MTQKEFEKVWRDANDSVICHTSGSTGVPKEIKLSKDFMKESAKRTNAFFNITSDSRLHTCLDFNYIASKMMTVRADIAGCMLTSEIPSSHPLQEISKDEIIDLLSVVPTQMDWIISSDSPWFGIRHILVGGAPIGKMLRRLISLSSYDSWETYGMTETASHIALRKIEDDDRPFVTFEGISVFVNENGCLVIDMPDGERLSTNDLAEVLSPNEFRILGRADNCVISGGIKIIPEELERQLGPFIAFDYCVSSVPDSKWGEKLVIVVDTSKTTLSMDLLKAAIGVRLKQYRKILNLGIKAPKEVICLSSLPKAANGKIDRKKLKEMLKNLY